MKAFKIWNEGEGNRIEVGENLETVMADENVEKEKIAELCEVVPGCYLGDEPYYLKEHDEEVYGDYILKDGTVIGAEDHTGEGTYQGDIDIPRTNELCREDGCNDFNDWEFNLWIGTYLDGSNWKVVIKEN